jgi:hypothetical protein
MTSKPDLGLIVAIVSGVAVIGAVIAGVAVVGSPGDARDQRLDDAHYQAIGEIATAVQCVYAQTGVLPPSIEEARMSVADISVERDVCNRALLRPDLDESVAYEPMPPNQINLCSDFRRPSPPLDRQRLEAYADRFPELGEERTEIGRRCYLIQLRRV